jgi:2,4-dienoyl-CoA reductase-like NADH-dependent reductase (Old Yellow Enzyme family)
MESFLGTYTIGDSHTDSKVKIGGNSYTKPNENERRRNQPFDLISFGQPFVSNPDLVARLKNNWPVVEADRSTYYTRNGEIGYIHFPRFSPGTEI